MLRIELLSMTAREVVFSVNGRLSEGYLRDLGALVDAHRTSGRTVVLDLADLSGIDRAAVAALGDAAGTIVLSHCPAFLRRWLAAQRESTPRTREAS